MLQHFNAFLMPIYRRGVYSPCLYIGAILIEIAKTAAYVPLAAGCTEYMQRARSYDADERQT